MCVCVWNMAWKFQKSDRVRFVWIFNARRLGSLAYTGTANLMRMNGKWETKYTYFIFLCIYIESSTWWCVLCVNILLYVTDYIRCEYYALPLFFRFFFFFFVPFQLFSRVTLLDAKSFIAHIFNLINFSFCWAEDLYGLTFVFDECVCQSVKNRLSILYRPSLSL